MAPLTDRTGVQKAENLAQAIDPRLMLAAIVDSSHDAIIGETLEGNITVWNPAAEKLFGYTAAEIVEQSVMRLVPPGRQTEQQEILHKLCNGEKIEHFETQRITKQGRLVEVSLTVSPVVDDTGRVIGGSEILREIGDRKRSDEALFRLAAIVESSDDVIISKDLNGVITSWNSAAQRIFGYEPEEIIGKSVLTLIPEHLQSEEPMILGKLRAGERIEHFETQRVTKSGEILDVSLSVSPIRDAKGMVIGASKIARDISERKRAQAALIQSEKLAATGRMAAVIAHEINNPLEAVTNLGYLLSVHPSLDQEARKYAQMLLSEVERASDITRQTLAFYRDTSRPVDVNVAEMIENLLDLHRNKLSGLNIKVSAELDRDAVIRGYSAELRQVFVNLLLNAMDAIQNNGQIRIRVRTLVRSGVIRITFADTGSGIAEQARRHIFEPFFTTKKSKGNGLGLWVSLGIVNKHHGKINMCSRTEGPLHGTVFSVTLPRYAPEPTTARFVA